MSVGKESWWDRKNIHNGLGLILLVGVLFIGSWAVLMERQLSECQENCCVVKTSSGGTFYVPSEDCRGRLYGYCNPPTPTFEEDQQPAEEEEEEYDFSNVDESSCVRYFPQQTCDANCLWYFFNLGFGHPLLEHPEHIGYEIGFCKEYCKYCSVSEQPALQRECVEWGEEPAGHFWINCDGWKDNDVEILGMEVSKYCKEENMDCNGMVKVPFSRKTEHCLCYSDEPCALEEEEQRECVEWEVADIGRGEKPKCLCWSDEEGCK